MAREELQLMAGDHLGYPDDRIDAALAAYRAEIRQEAAQEIRERIGVEDYPGESQRVRDLVSFGRSMADLIDPRT